MKLPGAVASSAEVKSGSISYLRSVPTTWPGMPGAEISAMRHCQAAADPPWGSLKLPEVKLRSLTGKAGSPVAVTSG